MTESPNTPASTTSSRMDLLYADSPLEPPPSIYGSGIYRSNSNESTSTVDSSWDVVEDLPVRWATDFVPLAAPGSRLQNCSVHSYALWRDENQRSRGGAFLAIIVKSNILLYETPKGERAFRYVKVNRPRLNLHNCFIEGPDRNFTHHYKHGICLSYNSMYKILYLAVHRMPLPDYHHIIIDIASIYL